MSYKKALSLNTYAKNVLDANFAVRGQIITRSLQIRDEIEKGLKHPFESLTELNVGNPHTFAGSKPVSFFREVVACMMAPHALLNNETISKCARNRAAFYLEHFKSMGSYTDSPGNPIVTKHIADYIGARDGFQANPKDIFVTNGASPAIARVMQQLAAHENVGFMVPVPQYPLYSAQITLLNSQFCGYYLDENNNWQISVEELKRSYDAAKAQGTDVKAIVIINPGNPTGQILDADVMEQILRFAHERSLMVMADEVYQENIWSDKKWHSFREVLLKMPEPFRTDIELASFHSASKGYMGECGVRGGYMELLNMDPIVYQMVNKVSGIELCSNTTGQVMVDLMINPPSQKMGESAETVESFRAEADSLTASLKRRANVAYTALNSMQNVSSNPVEGALYALAKVDFSQKFINEAESKGVAPDFLYCMQALEETGCILVPGSGFKQAPGTHHFRTTILPLPEERFAKTFEKLQEFNKKFHQNN